ncbi:zinc knuckle CX2CX4HX4C containing protein [Tanacetum coccineum]
MEGYGSKMKEVGDRIPQMKGLGAENADLRMLMFLSVEWHLGFLGNPSLGSNSNTSVNDQAAAIKEIHDVETLFGVKFTSQSDIDVFSMSIKEGKYANILSTMSTANIDVVVNAIETIGNKFQDKVNKVAGTHLKSSPMMSNFSPLVSPSTTISVPHELNSIDVAATFGVSLTNVGDLHKLINDIEAGKHDELLSGLTNADRMETLDALGSICNSIQANRNNAYVTPCKVSHADDLINLNVDESTIPSDLIIQSVDINTKSTSYAGAAGASAKDQPNVNSNFCTLVVDPVFDGVNVSIPRKVVKKEQLGETWAEKDYDEFQRLFFFKLDSRAGLEAVLEGGPWLIRKSLIILKKWTIDTRLLKEELTRIPIWVKLHDVPIQVFEEDGISLIATFIGKPVMLDSYTSSMCNESWGRSSFARCLTKVNSEADLVDVVTIGIPSLSRDGFTKETIRVEYEWRPPRCDICKIFGHVHDYCPKKVMSHPIVTTSNVATPTVEKTTDGFQTVGKKKKRKGKSKSTNGGQFTGPFVKNNVRYEPKATTTAPKKGATYVGNTSQSSSMLNTTGNSSKKDNISMSNSFYALNDEDEDDE